ncbi:MAG TPA: competence type IV pilus minor pilin ComGD [Bacillales bacterium]|nr:competence type IV pilus minor pilin ComGD [Bacillales bacterium]
MPKGKGEKGFTLIETLIVLFIVVSVSAITLVSFQGFHSAKQTDYFLEQIQKDLYFAQEYALSHHKEVRLVLDSAKHRYSVVTDTAESLLTRAFSPEILISSNFGSAVEFNPNGNIARFGTLTFRTPQGTYKMVFHIGKGRFYVKQ